MTAKLTPKQEAFALAFAKGGNASDAYREAYGAKDAPAKSINEMASRVLKNVKVASRIAELRAPVAEAAALDVERTLTEQLRGAYGQPADELTWAAKLKALDMANRIHGLYEKDNRQKAPNIAIQVQLVKATVAP